MLSTKYRAVPFLLGVCAIFNSQAFAVRGTWADSADLQAAVEYSETKSTQLPDSATTSVVLPITRTFNQHSTGLCWAYAFLNALETMYLVKHPDDVVELSRGAMQYINIQDRIALKLQGVEDHLNVEKYPGYLVEGGTAPDAAYIVEHFGIVQFGDYHDIIYPPNYANLLNAIFSVPTPAEQLEKSLVLLPQHFGAPLPEHTVFHDKKFTPVEFGKELLGKGKWISYAISKSGTDYVAQDPDLDARRGAMTNYISKENIVQKMRNALANGIPIIYSNIRHLVLIYGAEYGADGNPVKFYIKNSNGYPDFNYVADAEKIFQNLGEVTILEDV